MQTFQEQAGIAFDDIELLRDSQNRSFFARTGSRKQENGQNTDCVMARSPMSTSSACSAFSKSTCAYWGPDTKGGHLYLVAWEQVSSRGNVCYEEPRVGICSLRAVTPKLVKKAGAL